MRFGGVFMIYAMNQRWAKEYDPDGLNVNPVSIGGTAGDTQYIYWDGLIAKAMASSLTIKVPSPVALTGGSSGNITAQIQAAYLLVPPALLYKYGPMGLKLFVSYPDQQKLENTYALSPFKQQDLTQSGINKFIYRMLKTKTQRKIQIKRSDSVQGRGIWLSFAV